MRKTRHTEEQIAFALKQAETGSARDRRPSNSASETKSIDQISFAAGAAGCRSRLAALTLRRGFLS